MGEKIAEERGMTFCGFLADLIRRAKDRRPPMQVSVSADQAARFSVTLHAIDQLRKRIKSGEDYSNSMFDELRACFKKRFSVVSGRAAASRRSS